jgi:hypothetical protein
MAKRSPRSTPGNNRPQDTSVSDTFDRPSETFESPSAGGPDQAADMGERETRAVSMGSEPSEEDIRSRAYRRYLERGGGHGQDFDDWLEAERELKKQP